MAFNFKTAEDNYFNCLPSNITDCYLRENFSESSDRFNQLGRLFAYSLNNAQKQYLNSCGIQLAPIQNCTHPHPVSKIIENHLIYVCLPNHLKHIKRMVLCSIKAEKADYLFHKINDDGKTMEVINNLIENKDHFRYDPNSIIRVGYRNFSKFCHLARRRFNSPGKIKADCFFFHDELHFWSKDNMVDFLTEVQPKCILASIVFPIEAMHGYKSSMNSIAYEFEIHGNSLFFFPDGKKGQPYIQPADCWILGCNGISIKTGDSNDYYTVSLIESVGANHLISICRGRLKAESHRFFRDYDLIDLSKLKNPREDWADYNLKDSRVRGWVFRKTMSYMLCLKKGDVESALAKLRQLTDSEPMPAEVIIFGELFSLLEKSKVFKQKSMISKLFSSSFYLEKIREHSPFLSSLMPPGVNSWNDIIRSWILKACELKITVVCTALEFDDSLTEVRSLMQRINESSFTSIGEEILENVTSILPWAECSLLSTWLSKRSEPYSLTRDEVKYSIGIDDWEDDEADSFLLTEIDYHSLTSLANSLQLSRKVLLIEYHTMESESSREAESDYEGCETLNQSDERSSFLVPPQDQPSSSSIIRKNACFINALSAKIKRSSDAIISQLLHPNCLSSEELRSCLTQDLPLDRAKMDEICQILSLRVYLSLANSVIRLNDNEDLRIIHLNGVPGHVLMPKHSELTDMYSNSIIDRIYSQTYGLPPVNVSVHEIDLIKALNLLNCFNSMNFGILIDRAKIKDGRVLSTKLMSILERLKNKGITRVRVEELEVTPFLGYAGSGKTHCLTKELIEGSSNDFLFVSPRKSLIDQIHEKIEKRANDSKVCSSKSFCTFEKALLQNKKISLLVLDECSIYPPGYLDLMLIKQLFNDDSGVECLRDSLESCSKDFQAQKIVSCLGAHRNLKRLIVVGDVLQSSFFSGSCPKLDGKLDDLRSIISLSSEKVPYLYGTRRFGMIPNFLDLGFFSNEVEESNVILVKGLSALDEQLSEMSGGSVGYMVSSRADKDRFSLDYPNVMTINEAQGCTFDSSVLIITIDFFSTKFESLIVASSRHRRNLFMVIPNSILDSIDWLFKRSKLHANFIQKNFSVLQEETDERLRNMHRIKELPFGADFEIKCEGDPFLKAELSLVTGVQVDEFDVDEPTLRENLKTHVPISNDKMLEIEISELMQAREFREFKKEAFGWSEQFKDIPNSRDLTPTNSSMMPEAIFPRHRANDSLTFFSAVKKRLIFKEPIRNFQEFEAVKGRGKEMLNLFLKYVPLTRDFNQTFHEDSISEFEEKKISKSAAMIGAHHERSTKDWPINSIFLFQKSQLCTKLEKMYSGAKAGQTLACFSHNVLVRFAPINRYIEKKVTEALPSNLYIHQRKDFNEFEEWVIRNDFSGVCTESDFEAFDSSQDAFTLAFEVELMKYLGIGSSIIEDYIFIKMHLNCKLGNLAIMRFTGEFCTFLFNTLSNMLFTFMKYDVRKSDSICFAGDDMCANRRLSQSSSFEHILSRIRLKAKVNHVSNPTFCGWHLSKHGIVKNPRLIEARLKIAIQKQQVDLVINSYFLEYIYAYRKGDHIFEILDESQLEFHYIITRFFVQNKHKLNGKALDLFQDANNFEGGLYGEVRFGNPNLFRIAGKIVGGHASTVVKSSILVGSIRASRDCYEDFINERRRRDSLTFINGELTNRLGEQAWMEALRGGNDFKFNTSMNRHSTEFKAKSRGLFFDEMRVENQIDRERDEPLCCNMTGNLESFHKRAKMMNNEANIAAATSAFYRGIAGMGDGKGLFNPNLGHVMGRSLINCILKRESWQSYQSRNSLVASKGMRRGCILTAFNHPQFTKMLRCLTKKFSLQLRDSSHLLQCQPATQVGITEPTSTCWMMLNLRLLNPYPRIILLSTWGLFSLVSLVSSKLTSLLKGHSFTMIQGLRIQNKLARLASNSQCLVDRLTFCTAQIIQYQPVTRICASLQELSSTSLILGSKLIHMLSSLTSGFCIASVTTPVWNLSQGKLLGSNIRRFLGSQISLMHTAFSPMKIFLVSQICSSLTLIQGRGLRREGSSEVQVEVLERGDTQLSTRWLLSYLGQLLIDLKELKPLCFQGVFQHKLGQGNLVWTESSLKMSITNQLSDLVRTGLGTFIWENVLDPENRMGLTGRPAVAAEGDNPATAAIVLTNNQMILKASLLKHYLQYFFGNIAVLGASSQTEIPSTPLTVPRPTVEGVPAGIEYLPASLNLRTFVLLVREWAAQNANIDIRAMTFRNICEPFADEAYHFFRRTPGLMSNLYAKNPGSYYKAREVVFDFNKGLSHSIIEQKPEYARAISACNARLLNREGKKAVFDAQGTVNLSFDA